MSTLFKYGVLLGAGVVIWTFVMGFTGWYKDPALLNLFFLVIPFQIALLVWALKETAAQGRRYGGQVLAGVIISLIGGVLICAGSMVFTSIVFPHYFSEITAIQQQMLMEQGKSAQEIRTTMEMAAKTNTPVASAVSGFVGTVVTGLVASLVIGAFVRAK